MMLDGRTFESRAVTGHELVPGTVITTTFMDTRMSVRAGCNTMGTAYRIDGRNLVLAPEMAMTMMACAEDLMDQDRWVAGFLSGRVGFDLDGGVLTLRSNEGTIELVEQPDHRH